MIYTNQVPNRISETSSILFIGDHPREDDEINGQPFAGQSGLIFNQALGDNGLGRNDVSVSNLSQFRPQGNKFFHLYGSQQLREGQHELTELINSGQFSVIAPFGKEALEFVTGRKNIQAWRGSIITTSDSFRVKTKVIPSLHPSYIFQQQVNLPTFHWDMRRIISDSEFRDLRYTKREYIINPKGIELEQWTEKLCAADILGSDIESTYDATEIICIGFAPSPNLAVVIFLDTLHARNCVQRILSSSAKKIFHFGIYDRLALLEHEFEIEGPFADTYIAQQTLFPELPNSLSYLTSIYTREPYYKTEGRAEIPQDTKVWAATEDKSKLGIYNGKDCCTTREIFDAQQSELESDGLTHIYDFQIEALGMAVSISRNGIAVDTERKELLRKALYNSWMKKQWALNMLTKTPEKKTVNVQSPKLKELLYTTMGLPIRKKRNNKGEWVVTTDDDALVATIAYVKGKLNEVKKVETIKEWQIKLAIVELIHQIRGIRKLLSSYVEIAISKDGRIRSMYKVGGTTTGRWSCNKFIDDTGVNAQTFYRGSINVPDDVLDEVINIDRLFKELKKDEEQDTSGDLTEFNLTEEAA